MNCFYLSILFVNWTISYLAIDLLFSKSLTATCNCYNFAFRNSYCLVLSSFSNSSCLSFKFNSCSNNFNFSFNSDSCYSKWTDKGISFSIFDDWIVLYIFDISLIKFFIGFSSSTITSFYKAYFFKYIKCFSYSSIVYSASSNFSAQF